MKLLLLTILLAFCAAAIAATPEKRPTKIWNLSGPLGETPKHVTDAFPLSDQRNKGGWVKFEGRNWDAASICTWHGSGRHDRL
jgi:membrane-bound ClpP family serine protease